MFINIYEEGVLSVSFVGSNEHDTNMLIQRGQRDVENNMSGIVENNTKKEKFCRTINSKMIQSSRRSFNKEP